MGDTKAPRTKRSPAPRWPYLIALAAVLLDQWTKNWILTHYDLHESRELIPGIFAFTRTYNTGAAFSLFSGYPEVLTIFSVMVFCMMVIYRDKIFVRLPIEQVAFGCITGGVIGNVTDRIQHGHVVDFLHWYGGFDWPVFNVADSFICIGAFLYFISQFLHPETKP